MEEILAKYFSEEANDSERSLVESWRAESETNAKAFIEAKSVWLASRPMNAAPAHVLERILNESDIKKGRVVSIFSTSWKRYAVAASVVLAVALAFLFVSSSDSYQATQLLTDGSTIILHESSAVEVLKMDEHVREVSISGKAYFDIARDESRPFIIHTNNAVVKVLGTSFVVDTYGNKTEVSVESGLVELTKGDSDVSVLLEKGELGLVAMSNEGIIKKSIENENYLSWKTRVLTFKDAEMAEVSRVIEDVYGVKVVFDNPSFSDCKLTARINRKNIKDAMEVISRTFNVSYDYSKNEKKIVLKGKGC